MKRARKLLSEIDRLRETLGRSRAPEDLHDLRVALRRLRALSLSAPQDRAVRRFIHGLGPLRDAQVQLAWTKERSRSARPEERAELHALERALAERQARARRAATEALGRWKGLGDDPRALHRERHGRRKRLRKLERALEGAGRKLKPLPAHRLRIATRKLRYQLELRSGARRLKKKLEALQTALGELHDCDVRLALCRTLKLGRLTGRLDGERAREAERSRRAMEHVLE